MSCDFIFTCDAKFLIKYIFTFHILKNNYFFFRPIAITRLHSHKVPSPSQLGLGWFAAAAPNRQTSRPDQVIPLAAQCHPSIRRQHSPTSPDPRSTRVHIEFHPDSIPDREVSHHDSRLWRSLTGIITRNTSNYTRNTYI